MAETSVRREQGEYGEQVVLRNERLEVVWEFGAQMVLRNPHSDETRVAGGPLIELAPASGERHHRTLGLGHDQRGPQLPEPEEIDDVHGPGIQLTRSFPIAVQSLVLDWAVRIYRQRPFARCTLSLRNTGAAPLIIRRAFPFVTGTWWSNGGLRLGARQDDFAAYKTGWQSWSYAGGVPPGHRDPRPLSRVQSVWHNPAGRSPRQPVTGVVDVVSDGMALLGHSGEAEVLLAGFLTHDRWLTQVYAQRKDGALAACVLIDDSELAPENTIELPPLMLALGAPTDLLVEYAEAVAREQGARRINAAPTGWCSWYHYFQEVSEQAVLENVTALRAVRSALPVQVVQVDDGYLTAVGDWLEPNERFPRGLEYVADRIRAAGFQPGLWLAPFTVGANSRLAQEHPTWLVQGENGKPAYGGKNWNVDLYGLDTSHPDAQKWLRGVIRTIVRDWGYEYLKLDFLASGALEGRHFDSDVTRAQALREGLELIREEAGDDAFLLGCGCPVLSAVGIVDAMRIGPDTAAHWSPRQRGIPLPMSEGHTLPALEGAMRNTLSRSWMAPALWTNDPDCLLLRTSGSELTDDEVRAFASAVGLTGGMVVFSDRVGDITLARASVLARVLPPMPERALPLDVFEYGIAQRVATWVQRPWGRWLLVGLFNTSAVERELSVTWQSLGLAPGEYHAVEFWTGEYLGISETGTAVRVGGHGAAALAIRPTGTEPMLLGTSLHISQGGVEIAEWEQDREHGALHWQVELGRQALGTFVLWLPEQLRPGRLSSTASGATVERGSNGEVRVTAEIHDEARFTLELEGAS
jgi:alpha-galactosidase